MIDNEQSDKQQEENILEELDDASWLMEISSPYQAKVCELIDKLPNEIHIPAYRFVDSIITNYGSALEGAWANSRFIDYIKECAIIKDISYETRRLYGWSSAISNKILDMYDITLAGDVNSMVIDLEGYDTEKTLFILKKNNTSITESDIQELIKNVGYNNSAMFRVHVKDIRIQSIKNVAALFGVKFPSNIGNKKSRMLRLINSEVTAVFAQNKWRIHDADLAARAAEWHKKYLIDNDLSAFIKLTRLKTKTHDGLPINNIDEEV